MFPHATPSHVHIQTKTQFCGIVTLEKHLFTPPKSQVTHEVVRGSECMAMMAVCVVQATIIKQQKLDTFST